MLYESPITAIFSVNRTYFSSFEWPPLLPPPLLEFRLLPALPGFFDSSESVSFPLFLLLYSFRFTLTSNNAGVLALTSTGLDKIPAATRLEKFVSCAIAGSFMGLFDLDAPRALPRVCDLSFSLLVFLVLLCRVAYLFLSEGAD